MPQQPFVMRVHFYLSLGHGEESLQSAVRHVRYMGWRKKAEVLRGSDESGYFGSLAYCLETVSQSILRAKGPVWRVIASVGEQDAIAMGGGLLTKAGWEQVVGTMVPRMVRRLMLDPMKVQWIAVAHRYQQQAHNPHVHCLLWEEGVPSRKTGMWADTERRRTRQDWMAILYAPLYTVIASSPQVLSSPQRPQSRRSDHDIVLENPLGFLWDEGCET